jgi:hypothetical protein
VVVERGDEVLCRESQPETHIGWLEHSKSCGIRGYGAQRRRKVKGRT